MNTKKTKKPSLLFEFLKGMTEKKTTFDFSLSEINKEYDQYIINRFVSMTQVFIPIVNQMNKIQNISNETHYEFYKSILPKKSIYFNYIKKEKEVNKYDIECIAKYFEISLREARMYCEVLKKEDIKKIVKKFDYGRK